MKSGTRVKFKEKICPGIPINRTGKILTEYKNFYLVLTTSGYRECLNKNMLAVGETRMEVLN